MLGEFGGPTKTSAERHREKLYSITRYPGPLQELSATNHPPKPPKTLATVLDPRESHPGGAPEKLVAVIRVASLGMAGASGGHVKPPQDWGEKEADEQRLPLPQVVLGEASLPSPDWDRFPGDFLPGSFKTILSVILYLMFFYIRPHQDTLAQILSLPPK